MQTINLMQISLHPFIALPIAAIAGLAAIGIWYYLLRPVPEQHQTGIIERIEFAAKETVEKTEMRSLRNADDLIRKKQYTLPDRFIYTITLADGKTARYAENAPHAKAKPGYAVGQKLLVTYQLRPLPFGRVKILINSMRLPLIAPIH
jgi:hypothetical protein